MAFITLAGTLRDPASELAVGDQIRFTHKSTTGETVEGAVSVLTIDPSGTYSKDLQYGLVLVEYKDVRTSQFKNLGVATVNGSNPATSIPELLNALVPVSSAELIEFQAILADAVTAKNESVVARNEAEAFANSIDLINDLSQAYEFETALLMTSSSISYPQKKRTNTKERTVGQGGAGSYDTIATGTTVGVDLPNNNDILQSTTNPATSFKLRVEKGKYLNVKALGAGAFASAAVNVTAMQRALVIADLVSWPDEIYSVDSTIGNNILINTALTGNGKTLLFIGKAELASTTNGDESYRVLWIDTVNNVTIYNGVFRGDKSTHTGTTGEGGHAIGCYNVNGLNLYNCEGHDTWGVGLAIVNCNDVYGENIWCDNGRQNSAAIVSGTNIKLVNPRFSNASGTAPAAGIDIEPNLATDRIENISIINPVTWGNEGVGVQVSIGPFVDSDNDVTISIVNHVDKGSERAFWVSQLGESTTGEVSGSIDYIRGKSFDALKSGILVSNYASEKSPRIFIDSPAIYRPNASGATLAFDSSGIACDRASAFANTNTIGNIYIKNPTVIDDRVTKKMINCINMTDFKNTGYKNTIIEDPLVLTGVVSGDVNAIFKIGQNVVFSDKFDSISENIITSKALSGGSAYGSFSNTGATGLVTFNLPASFNADTNLTKIKFKDNTGLGIRLEPLTGRNILPLSASTDKYIQSTAKGCSITIQKYDNDTWYVLEIIGTWTVEP